MDQHPAFALAEKLRADREALIALRQASGLGPDRDFPHPHPHEMAVGTPGEPQLVVYTPEQNIERFERRKRHHLGKVDIIGGGRALREALSSTNPRLAQLEDHAIEVRAMHWDGYGEMPRIPAIPAWPPADQVRTTDPEPLPGDERIETKPDPRDEAIRSLQQQLEDAQRKLSEGLSNIEAERQDPRGTEGEGGDEPEAKLDEEDEIVATINVKGVDYNITGRDTMLFTAALVRGLNQEASTIRLASGDVLELTLADIEDIAAQLVGPMQ